MDARNLLGDDARVVARRLVLLVAHVLFLVEDDEADVIGRREERRARADDDARLIAAHAQDGVVALREAQAAVHDDEVIGKVRLERHDDLSRQRDFRHEHDDAAAGRAHALGELDVDLRLAAARDALQKEALVARGIDGRVDACDDLPLVLGQLHCLMQRLGIAVAVAQHAAAADFRKAGRLEVVDGRKADMLLLERGKRQLRFLLQERQEVRLCLLAAIRLQEPRRDLAAERDIFLVLGRVALLRLVDLADDVVLLHLVEKIRRILLPLGQRLADGGFLLRPLAAQVVVDSAAARHREHHMVSLILCGLVAHGDAQAALARHEEPHDLG